MKVRRNSSERGRTATGAKTPSWATLRSAATHEQTSSTLPSTHGQRSDRAGPSSTASAPSERTTIAAGRQLRILVVEDEAIIAMELEMMLQDLGVDVIGIAMTAEDAVRLAKAHCPDCATMDISIKGGRDGVSAAIEIYRELGIRSIFVSAYGNDETKARAAPAQPFGWLKKPVDIEDLRSALNLVVDED